MSRSDRGELAKTGGLAVLLAVFCAWLWAENVPDHPALPAYEYGQTKESNYYPGGSPCHPSALVALKGQEALRQRDRCAEAAEDHRLKSDDLVQQTRAADAAAASAYQTYRQTRLLLIGAILGVLTLIAASFAAIYARKAFLTQDTSFKLLSRPFVYLEKMKAFQRAPGIFEVEFRVRNSGATPAINVTADLWAEVLPLGSIDNARPPLKVAVRYIAPGGLRKLMRYIAISDEDMRLIRRTRKWACFTIDLTFDSKFVTGKNIHEVRTTDGQKAMKEFFIPQPDDAEILAAIADQPEIPDLLPEQAGDKEA